MSCLLMTNLGHGTHILNKSHGQTVDGGGSKELIKNNMITVITEFIFQNLD